MKRWKKTAPAAGVLLVVLVVLFALLRWKGLLLLPNETKPNRWETWGVDVSSYQGEVDWPALRSQGVDFAFIKATEGSGTTDPCFARNWADGQAAGVLVGAYHFFSYDSSGETQADNFIAQVPVTAGALPPVVDVEFYGEKAQNPPTREAVKEILDPLLERLEAHYGQKPILYGTYRTYKLYIQGEYVDYPLWVTRPLLAPTDKDWSFWQYSHSARLEGYNGKETHIDLNVFRGSLEELKAMGAVPSEVPSAEPEVEDWEKTAESIFDSLKKKAYPRLAEYGLDLDKMEEDLHTYAEAQSELDAYIACEDDPTLDFEAEGQRARAVRYEDFVRGMRDAENFGTGAEPESREVALDNPIDQWTQKWLYLDGTTIAMNMDGWIEQEIWEKEVCHVYDVLAERVRAAGGPNAKVQRAKEMLLEFAPAYGDCVSLYCFSSAFMPEWWQEHPDDPIARGTIVSSWRRMEAVDCYRREVFMLWDRLGAENATWVFEPSAYEAELQERYQQVFGKDISEFQLLPEEGTS